MDVSITGVYRNAVLADVSRIPGFAAAKSREDAKLDEDFRSPSPVARCHGGRHRLVPFVLEEGGRFGDHALALLAELAEQGALSGKLKAPESWSCSSPRAASSYWIRRWMQEISAWLQTRFINYTKVTRTKPGFRLLCLKLFYGRLLEPHV